MQRAIVLIAIGFTSASASRALNRRLRRLPVWGAARRGRLRDRALRVLGCSHPGW
jgi:hypothetical protein